MSKLDPIRAVLEALTGEPPPPYVTGEDFSGLSEAQEFELQQWAATHAKPNWLPGIAVLEAAALLVGEAVLNNNIFQSEEGDWETK